MGGELSFKYKNYFSSGIRVNVALSHCYESFYNEWWEVGQLLDHDLIEVLFPHDLLPDSVQLSVGNSVELRSIFNSSRYSCRGIVVEKGDTPRLFNVRLTGSVFLDEPRAFYRIDVYLPLTYRMEPNGEFKPATEGLPEYEGAEGISTVGEETYPLPVSANISGSGLSSWLPEKMIEDQVVELLLYIPLPDSGTRTIPVKGKVVKVSPKPLGSPSMHRWKTSFHFQQIDELDRDKLVRYINCEQSRLVRSREWFFRKESYEKLGNECRRLYNNVLCCLILLLICLLTGNFFACYYRHHEKTGVAKIFEEGLYKYLGGLGSAKLRACQ